MLFLQVLYVKKPARFYFRKNQAGVPVLNIHYKPP